MPLSSRIGSSKMRRKIALAFIAFPILAIGQTSMTKTVYCPPVSALTKDPLKQRWSAPGGFKSYDLSFVTSITGFLGAQWRGATIGQVTCVYKGLPKNSFNVLLAFRTLSLEPTTLAWGKNLGGYRNCLSRKRKSCPFEVRVQAPKGNLYQEIENFKS